MITVIMFVALYSFDGHCYVRIPM